MTTTLPLPLPLRVIVTRPAREASRWTHDLREAGFDAVSLPLIAIEPVLEAGLEALDDARERMGDCTALMFVSAPAVEHFLPRADEASFAGDSGLPRFWATGPGTVRALRRAGVPESRIDSPAHDAGQFDSEALWTCAGSQIGPGARVLIVRGGDADGRPTGRDWLAREVGCAGGALDTVVAYRRLAPTFGDAERRLASEAAADGSVWLFSSSESIGHLVRAMPSTDWRAARAVATHPRIGNAAREAGFGTVGLSQPGSAALVASIESFK
ncbi:uroporphyrinogen-III synthase [Variovorax sp. RHLX14]|uniref:uroporphyrinogen-III synthase n=1 Tax=Variovorax sp. RHLX14 TaxID=1259731 RepID=UPI003F46D480